MKKKNKISNKCNSNVFIENEVIRTWPFMKQNLLCKEKKAVRAIGKSATVLFVCFTEVCETLNGTDMRGVEKVSVGRPCHLYNPRVIGTLENEH